MFVTLRCSLLYMGELGYRSIGTMGHVYPEKCVFPDMRTWRH